MLNRISIALRTPAFEEARRFYVEAWGLTCAEVTSGRAKFATRGSTESTVPALSLVRAPRRGVHCVYFELDSADAVMESQRSLEGAGAKFLAVEEWPALEAAFSVLDPDGRRVQIGYSPKVDSEHGDSSDYPSDLAHVVLNTPHIDETYTWYVKHLGLRVREWREHSMVFLWGNEDHHSLALNAAPHASLNHVAWHISDIDAFMRAVRRVADHPLGDKIFGPGRHGPGRKVFCYFRDPSGLLCEYETDGITIPDPSAFPEKVWERSPTTLDLWSAAFGGMNERFKKWQIGVPDADAFDGDLVDDIVG